MTANPPREKTEMVNYEARGKQIFQLDPVDGDIAIATCDEPEMAIKMMKRAGHLNDDLRKYTAAARLFYQVEQLPGFAWISPKRED